MIRVVHIVSGDLWAGAEVMVFNLLKGLHALKKIEIHTVLLNEGRLNNEIRNIGIRTYVLDEKSLSFVKITNRFKKIVSDIGPNVVHSHRYKENIISFLNAKVFGGYGKLITTQHGLPESFNGNLNMPHKIVSWLNFLIMKSVFDKIVCVSKDIKSRFNQQFGIMNEKLTVIHNGVFVPGQKKFLNKDGIFRIGTAGRLFPVKDFPLFINMAYGILQNEKNVNFLLAGEGPEIGKLKKLTDEFQIADKVKFLGHLEIMDPFFRGLDLYVNTSVHEGIPMSVLEAMAFGVPVVAPKTGGLCEIVEDAKSGYLINSRDPKEFADVCLNIINNRKLHRNLSIGAHNRVSTAFSTEHMAECYYRLYRELGST